MYFNLYKNLLDNLFENKYNIDVMISDLQIHFPNFFKEYNDYYDSFLGKNYNNKEK